MAKAVKTDIGPFAIVPLWLIERATPSALRVYALLAAKWASNETGECWPHRHTMGEILGISERSVTRAVAELVEIGALEVKPQFDDRGDQTSNLYTVFTTRPPLDKYDQGAGHQRPGGVTNLSSPVDTGVQAGEPDSLNQTHRTRSLLPQHQDAEGEYLTPTTDSLGEENDVDTQDYQGSAPLSHPSPITPEEGVAPTRDSAPEGNSTGRPKVDDTPDPEVVRLCNLLADLYHELGNTRPNPDQKAWHRDCRLLLTKDGPDGKGWTPKQVETIMRWALADSFWCTNIRSMPKLRAQFDMLRGRRNETLTKSTGATTKYQSDMDRLNAAIAKETHA